MKHNIFILLFLSLSVISCTEDETDTNSETAKTINDNWTSSVIFAELTIMDKSRIVGLQMTGNSTLGLRSGDYLLSQTLNGDTSCVCGTDFIGNDLNGSFIIQQCEIEFNRYNDPGICSSLITTGSYEIQSNKLILTPSSGSIMTFQ